MTLELDPGRTRDARKRVLGQLQSAAEHRRIAETYESQATAIAQIWALDIIEIRQEAKSE
jgi:hypothetical protein